MLKSLPYIPLLLSSLAWSSFTFFAEAADEKSNVVVPAFKANYTILRGGKSLGKATRKLSYLENNFAQYSYRTDIEWLIFSDIREEISLVKLKGDKVIPTHYEYTREGTGSDKHYQWSYDTENNKAIDEKKNRTTEIDFPENIQDKLSYHLQLRLNMIKNPQQKHFVYPVVSTHASVKNYVYQHDGEEEIMLPYGLVKTIRLKREVVEKERITYAWFAPELDYLLVKLHQIKGGVEQFEAQLESVDAADQTIPANK